MTAIENEIKSNVLALLNATDKDKDNQYTIFGMIINESAIDYAITLAYNYIAELIGSVEIELSANRNKVVGFGVDLSMLRVWATLGGISIPTHFNYKTGDLTITKIVSPIIEANVDLYLQSIKRWIKIMLSGSWTAVNEQDNLAYTSPIYDDNYGYDSITYDAQL